MVGLLDLEPASGNFFPPVFINDFWLLKDYLQPINASATALELDLFLAPLSAWWWTVYVQMEQSFKMQASMGSMGDGEADEIKVSHAPTHPFRGQASCGGHVCDELALLVRLAASRPHFVYRREAG